MKRNMSLIVAALAGTVLVAACGQKQETPTSTPPAPPAAVTTPAPSVTPPAAVAAPQAPANVVDLLANAKSAVAQAMTLAKEGKYQDGLALLQKTAAEVAANPDAMKLVNDAMATIKKMATDAATKAATDKLGSEASKALGGLGK